MQTRDEGCCEKYIERLTEEAYGCTGGDSGGGRQHETEPILSRAGEGVGRVASRVACIQHWGGRGGECTGSHSALGGGYTHAYIRGGGARGGGHEGCLVPIIHEGL